MAAAIKQSTFLTGLPVAKNARANLLLLYTKTLKQLSKIPESSIYRKNTEEIINFRSSIVTKEIDIGEIEKKIGCGQIEELLIQAKNELELAKRMLVYRPWESLTESPPKNQWKWPL